MTERQPKGIPSGGQFAASAHDEATAGLPGAYSHEEIDAGIRKALDAHMDRITENAEDYLDEIGVDRMVSVGSYYDQPEYAEVELTFDDASAQHFIRVAEEVSAEEPDLVRFYPSVEAFTEDIVGTTMGERSSLPSDAAQPLYEIVGREENKRDEFSFEVVEHKRYNIIVGASVER